jgi:WD40 repeat protein
MLARFTFAALVFAVSALATHAGNDPYGDPLPPGAKTRLGTVRYRVGLNTSPIVTPDAKTIYARDNWALRRYDIAGAALGPLPPGSPTESPTVFSADGARAVTASGKTVVWDLASGKTLATVKKAVHFFDRGLPLVDLSADGKVLAIGGNKARDGKGPVEVLVWDVDRDKEIARFLPPQNEQAFVALGPDGKTVASWGKSSVPAGKAAPEPDPGRYVNFWDAATGKPLSQVRAPGLGPSAVAFSPDGAVAAVAGMSTIELFDPKTGASKHLLLGRSGVGRALAFTPDGTTLFATSNGGLVQRWRAADGARLSTTDPPLPDLHYCSVRATGADRGVAWATHSSAVVVWEVPSGKLLGPQDGHFGAVHRLTVTPDNRSVLTSAHDGRSLAWELATGKLIGPAPGHPWRGRFGTGSGVAEFAPGGGRALVSDYGGYGVHDGTTGVQEFVIPITWFGYQKAAFTADGSKVVLSLGSYDGKKEPASVSVWDVAAAKRVFALQLPGHSTTDAALTPNGKHLVTASSKPAEKGSGEFVIAAWEVPGGAKRGEFREEAGSGYGYVATAGDNDTAAVVTSKSKLVRFDLATGKATPVSSGIESVSSAPVFSLDGKSLAVLGPSSFGRPSPVVVLDWETGKVRQTFACPDGGATTAAFSPDGKYLITGTSQGTALVWELAR